ncbi:MAG: sugar transferase [Planctomycetaceae bacterium]|nr:sugar transferase [Planctomycetaceae bacterium]
MNLPEYNFLPFKQNILPIILIYMVSFVLSRFYKKRFTSFWELFKRIFTGMVISTTSGVIFLYLLRYKYLAFPSSIFLISFFVGVITLFLSHAIILDLLKKINKKIIIIGHQTIEEILEQGSRIEEIRIKNVEQLLNYRDADEIVICEKFHSDNQMNLLVYLLLELKIKVVFSPKLYLQLLAENILEQSSIQFLTSVIGRKSDFEEFLMRALDIAGSILFLLCASPLIILGSILIWLTSGRPIFYKQERLTKNGESFVLYKFRTMINNAEDATGPVLATENDSRITKIGRFLRQTRFDEIPQLFNILKGDMSLVGPRPERPHFIKSNKLLRESRLAVKPGLTGFAQIRKLYDLHPRHKIKYDYLYIQKRSVLVNLYILLKTIPVILMRKGR